MPTESRTIHPVRGLLWGLLVGHGLAIALVLTTVISLDALAIGAVVVATAIAGVLWSTLGPARVTGEAATFEPSREPPRPPGQRPTVRTTDRAAHGGAEPHHAGHDGGWPGRTDGSRTTERVVAT